MTNSPWAPGDITRYRLLNQQIAASRCKEPAEVVAALGAMQAQDYLGTLWAIGLRLPAATEMDVERAIADRTIVRTWPLRSTLHFVAAADVHWLLKFLGPRIIATGNLRYERYGLDKPVLGRIRKVLIKALQGKQELTRDECPRRLNPSGRGSFRRMPRRSVVTYRSGYAPPSAPCLSRK